MPCPDKIVIKSYVREADYQWIKAHADQARLSVSKYVQAVCMGYEPKSKIDHEALLAMLEVNRDLSRLGNLLKLAIAQESLDESKADELLKSITETKSLLMEKVKAI